MGWLCRNAGRGADRAGCKQSLDRSAGVRGGPRVAASRVGAVLLSGLAGLTVSPAAAKDAAPWERRAMFGGEVSATQFGIADFGLRKGALSLQLLTDTLEVRYAPELRRGRYWVAARLEAPAAGLLISPWRDGAPDPERALLAGYLGADGGYLRYLPAGLYAGVSGAARLYLFAALPQTTIAPPGPTPLFTADAILGHHTDISHIWLRAGADAELHLVAPHLAVEAVVRPDWPLAPRVEVRAAWALNQDFLTRTRLGGLNPYVVPLAGAGWAEFWVESYIAVRAGPSLRMRLPGRVGHSLELTPVADVAGFDGSTAAGFALLVRWRYGRYFIDAQGGYAPFIKRQEGVTRAAGLLLAGTDWDGFGKRKRKPRTKR